MADLTNRFGKSSGPMLNGEKSMLMIWLWSFANPLDEVIKSYRMDLCSMVHDGEHVLDGSSINYPSAHIENPFMNYD